MASAVCEGSILDINILLSTTVSDTSGFVTIVFLMCCAVLYLDVAGRRGV